MRSKACKYKEATAAKAAAKAAAKSAGAGAGAGAGACAGDGGSDSDDSDDDESGSGSGSGSSSGSGSGSGDDSSSDTGPCRAKLRRVADREAREADDGDLRLIAEGAEEGVVELGDEARRIGGQARRQSARESRTNE